MSNPLLRKNKKNISICHLLKVLPRVPSVKMCQDLIRFWPALVAQSVACPTGDREVAVWYGNIHSFMEIEGLRTKPAQEMCG